MVSLIGFCLRGCLLAPKGCNHRIFHDFSTFLRVVLKRGRCYPSGQLVLWVVGCSPLFSASG